MDFDNPKYLVISPVGKGSLHSNWLTPNKKFDVILAHYDTDSENMTVLKNEFGVNDVYKKGVKFKLVQELFEKNKHLFEYDYFIFLDDDILMTAEQINKLFETANEFKLNCFHPAIEPLNYWHEVMFAKWGSKLRYTAWSETQSIGMSKSVLEKVISYFDENQSNYGYPNLWHKLHDYSQDFFAVIDEVVSIHTRALASGENNNYSMVEGGLKGAMVEFENLLKKYDIKKPYFPEFIFWTKPPLSVVVIYTKDDAGYLPELISTLPEWCELILAETIISDEFEHGAIKNIEREEKTTKLKIYSNRVDFAMYRNKAKSIAIGGFILMLDADERLLIHQHSNLLKELVSLLNKPQMQRYGGIAMNVISIYMNVGEIQHGEVAKITRLFRNLPEFEYRGEAHENIEFSILEAGYLNDLSTFKIEHLGYERPTDDMIKKLERNIDGMLRSADLLLKYEEYKRLLIRDVQNLNNLMQRTVNIKKDNYFDLVYRK
jgi:hypothetical protein